MKSPYIIEFSKIGSAEIGFISVLEGEKLVPFKTERLFWTYFTPDQITRGRHAHYVTEQVLVAVAGIIRVTLEHPDGKKEQHVLDKPTMGLYVPPNCWHTMEYSHASVQLVFASTKYNEADYIRDYKKFKEVYKP